MPTLPAVSRRSLGLLLPLVLTACLTPPAQTGALRTTSAPAPVAPAPIPVLAPVPTKPVALYPGETLEDDETLTNLIFDVVEAPFQVAFPIVTDQERTAACIRVHGRPKGGGDLATRWVIIQAGQVELVPLQKDAWKMSPEAERTIKLLCAQRGS